jgi:hypothetical protein
MWMCGSKIVELQILRRCLREKEHRQRQRKDKGRLLNRYNDKETLNRQRSRERENNRNRDI